MLVNVNLLVVIKNLYIEYQECDDIDDFMFSSRKRIKILVDSIWEQSINKILNLKPRNAKEALRCANISLKNDEINEADLPLITALIDMLENYRILDDKTYIDYADDLVKIMDNHFYHLVFELCDHPTMADNGQSLALKRIITE